MGYCVQMTSDAMIGCSLYDIEKEVIKILTGAVLDCNLVCKVHKNQDTISLMVFNKYYYRAKDYISLSLMLTVNGDRFDATIISAEPAEGLIDLIWRSDDDFVQCTEEALVKYGFTVTDKNKI